MNYFQRSFLKSRREFLVGSSIVLAGSFFGNRKVVLADARFSQSISLFNTHTNESIEVTFWDGVNFVPESVSQIEWTLRDWRTGQVSPIDMRLILLLRNTAMNMKLTKPFHVISAFRSQTTNLMLHHNDPEGVPEQSYHMYGMAIDVRLPEVDTEVLRDNLLFSANGHGGVGYYPNSNFVHLDTGRVHRFW